MYSINLEGKKGLILGVSNARSIAWAIAGPVAQAGARLAFSYQGERLKSTLEKLTKDLSEPVLFPCDVTNDEELDALFEEVEAQFGTLDFVVHALAFCAPRDLRESFLQGLARGLAHRDGRVRLFARGGGATGAAAYDGGAAPSSRSPISRRSASCPTTT